MIARPAFVPGPRTRELLAEFPRSERRLILRDEERRRRSGNWPAWEVVRLPFGVPGTDGWAREFRRAHRNLVFSVLDRTLSNGVRHLAIASMSGVRPTWPEAQRIKDEIAGTDATAVEVYPPAGEVVDAADMFHLWVLPAPLPFSLWDWGRS